MNITNNQRETIAVQDSVTKKPFHVLGNSSDGSINVNITSGGSGGTQYTDGAVAVTHPVGTQQVFTNGSGNVTAVSTTNPLPITGSISVGGTTDESTFTAGTSTFTSSGGVFNDGVTALSSGQQGAQRLTANRAIHTNLRNVAGTEIGTATTPLQVSLANTATNATAVKVDGSGVTQPVSLTSTTITGTVAVTQATASSLNATVVGTGTLSVQNTAATPAGTNLIGKVGIDQTTPGTTNAVSANQGTAAALGSPWPVYNGEQNDFTGTFTNATQTTSVTATNLDGYGNILISINGTYGTATAVFEGSDDSGTTWYAVDAAQTSGSTIEGGYTSLSNVTRSWQINVPGFDSVRVRSTAVASGTVNVRMSASAALGADASAVSIGSSIPSGTNVIGHVIADSGSTTAVTQATAASLNATVVGTGTFAVQAAATLNAETTKVIGVVRTADGSGNLLTSTSNALDINIKSGNPTTMTVTQATGTNLHAVVDSGAITANPAGSSTATLANVAGSVTSVTALASNTNRREAIFYNDSSSDCYIKYGATASNSSFTYYLPSLGTLSFTGTEYTGLVAVIWISATGNLRVTETSV